MDLSLMRYLKGFTKRVGSIGAHTYDLKWQKLPINTVDKLANVNTSPYIASPSIRLKFQCPHNLMLQILPVC